MKIAWIQDFDIFSYQGGAEMNDAAHFSEGLRRNHDITLIGSAAPYYTPDALIISNCVTFDKARLANMVSSAPTIFFFHDYIFCNWRLFYPMIQHCGACESAKYWLDLFLKAKLLIWLSPLHRDATLVAFPELKDMPYALIPSAVNPDPFLSYPKKLKRLNAYLSVNSLEPFKGRDNLLNFAVLHDDLQLHILGARNEKLPGNITLLPPTTYDEMPSIYSKYEYYIELPSTPQPFNRTVVEAKLSGCKVITNHLMGAASWEWFKETPEVIAAKLKAAPADFWTAVEGALK